MLELVNVWKQKEVEVRYEQITNVVQRMRKYKEEHGSKYCLVPEFKPVQRYLFSSNEQIRNEVVKDVELHFRKLQKKVEDKIGVIERITPTTNGYNYTFVGEKGYCEVKVILAGGYNIQRLHTRWIVKK